MPVNRLIPGLLPRLHIAPRLWLAVGSVFVYSLAVALVVRLAELPAWNSGAEWAAANSLILGILVGFRNKEAYDRWWEGRKLWGQLVNDSRNLILKVRTYVDPRRDDFQRFADLLVRFPQVLALHLHRAPKEEFEAKLGFVPDHPPGYVAGQVFEYLDRWRREGLLDGSLIFAVDAHARGLMDVCGACERIRNTPLPSSYRALTRHGIGFYLVASPWLFILDLGFYGIPPLLIALYFLLGVELIAEEVEQPFSERPDDLPLETFCRTIEESVRQARNLDYQVR